MKMKMVKMIVVDVMLMMITMKMTMILFVDGIRLLMFDVCLERQR